MTLFVTLMTILGRNLGSGEECIRGAVLDPVGALFHLENSELQEGEGWQRNEKQLLSICCRL
jgi:hypothetical protein